MPATRPKDPAALAAARKLRGRWKAMVWRLPLPQDDALHVELIDDCGGEPFFVAKGGEFPTLVEAMAWTESQAPSGELKEDLRSRWEVVTWRLDFDAERILSIEDEERGRHGEFFGPDRVTDHAFFPELADAVLWAEGKLLASLTAHQRAALLAAA